MKKRRFGFQGIAGAYSEMAVLEYIKTEKISINDLSKQIIGFETFEEIFEAVDDNKLDFGVVPVENSLAGSIHKNFDLLGKHNLKVVGEVYVHVNHQLIVNDKSKLSDIKEVYSHWQALAQCEHNIKKHLPKVKVIEYFDTAGSAKFIKDSDDITKASIASTQAAKSYGLKILKENFQDEKENYTRFLIVSRDFLKFDKNQSNDKYKTSIIFAGKNITGFLFKALACFSLRDINLSKIESRPIPKSPWGYYFYIDFEGKFNDDNVEKAILNLREICEEVKVLGSYKSWGI